MYSCLRDCLHAECVGVQGVLQCERFNQFDESPGVEQKVLGLEVPCKMMPLPCRYWKASITHATQKRAVRSSKLPLVSRGQRCTSHSTKRLRHNFLLSGQTCTKKYFTSKLPALARAVSQLTHYTTSKDTTLGYIKMSLCSAEMYVGYLQL